MAYTITEADKARMKNLRYQRAKDFAAKVAAHPKYQGFQVDHSSHEIWDEQDPLLEGYHYSEIFLFNTKLPRANQWDELFLTYYTDVAFLLCGRNNKKHKQNEWVTIAVPSNNKTHFMRHLKRDEQRTYNFEVDDFPKII